MNIALTEFSNFVTKYLNEIKTKRKIFFSRWVRILKKEVEKVVAHFPKHVVHCTVSVKCFP